MPTNPTPNSTGELSQISALALVDELLRRGYPIDALCAEVGMSNLDELLHRLQRTQVPQNKTNRDWPDPSPAGWYPSPNRHPNDFFSCRTGSVGPCIAIEFATKV